jgi:hypothetical protein
MRSDIRNCGPAEAGSDIVPAQLFGVEVWGAVEPVTTEISEVDAAHERHDAVDDDQLLVMTMHRTVAVVQGAPDGGSAQESLHQVSRLGA